MADYSGGSRAEQNVSRGARSLGYGGACGGPDWTALATAAAAVTAEREAVSGQGRRGGTAIRRGSPRGARLGLVPGHGDTSWSCRLGLGRRSAMIAAYGGTRAIGERGMHQSRKVGIEKSAVQIRKHIKRREKDARILGAREDGNDAVVAVESARRERRNGTRRRSK